MQSMVFLDTVLGYLVCGWSQSYTHIWGSSQALLSNMRGTVLPEPRRTVAASWHLSLVLLMAPPKSCPSSHTS